MKESDYRIGTEINRCISNLNGIVKGNGGVSQLGSGNDNAG